VWKTLRDQRVPVEIKRRIVRAIKFLASGEWRPQLCRKVIYYFFLGFLFRTVSTSKHAQSA
jgi:hypothetical protein